MDGWILHQNLLDTRIVLLLSHNLCMLAGAARCQLAPMTAVLLDCIPSRISLVAADKVHMTGLVVSLSLVAIVTLQLDAQSF